MSIQWMLDSRGLFDTAPPNPRTKLDNNATLLVSWWATGFSLAIIVTRVFGRYVRTERFFMEDKVMLAGVIPLLIRMACVHVILIWGTNNVKTAGLSAENINHRVVGSKLVLVARIFYAVFIWTAKFTVCEFLKRVSGMIWRRSLDIFRKSLYYFLASTLLAVVIATLAECTPFAHYWQVIPDPGPKCRLGYANLIVMGTCDVITDLLLVAFPIPFIMMTHMPLKRKAALVVLFALSLILVAITLYRVPSVIWHDGEQQYRSLLASLEILVATAVSNAVVIGSFVRDKGLKKNKFKKALASASVSENMDYSSFRRQTITHHQWGSDSDLAAGLGIRLEPELCSSDRDLPRPAPVAAPYHTLTGRPGGLLNPNWSFTQRPLGGMDDDRTSTTGSLDIKVSPHEYIQTNLSPPHGLLPREVSSPTQLSIFDVGGLLSAPTPTTAYPSHYTDQPRHGSSGSGISAVQDFGAAISSPDSPNPDPDLAPDPNAAATTTYHRHRHPSSASLPYASPRAGGLRRTSLSLNRRRASSVHFSEFPDSPVPSYRSQPDVSAPIPEGDDVELQDVGGLLSRR
ncbi:putative integral membrane protein Pth11-like [Aspergillus saccharolyticus JOP 1030-1]|uniref:Integral membrane protein Pth11-like protein n=1 Tax=Aspergillus saccharolyticus JOP 1030-1 TaxID=1450539 RepID=A0A318ZSP7_9EURO|nr:integral membrane protein Pth11-like protein [Aspergillus saccharolyticus JOP 1030-1]PYH49715.1 integral membrane protein Pth11-like protein [Aspergillus saccharolyticus JOP 1030-1]